MKYVKFRNIHFPKGEKEIGMYPDFKERRDPFLIKCIFNYSLTSLFYET